MRPVGPLVAALPATHRLAGYERVPLAALADESFVLYFRDSGPIVHDTIIGCCLAAGFSPRIVQEAQLQTIPALVAAGLGISLLISPTPPHDPSQVVYRPIQDDLPLWDMALAWSPSNQSPTGWCDCEIGCGAVAKPREPADAPDVGLTTWRLGIWDQTQRTLNIINTGSPEPAPGHTGDPRQTDTAREATEAQEDA
ncbi:LysR family substrate-binding domain-containing protein [Actinoallomurus sp. CA-150999]|uniref:LysR family substrate-binding domain-containing protein n=1 Tax=Actinoallomurus sp. CA-150999 TaxID=3239887 RepID=UPI003D8CE05F